MAPIGTLSFIVGKSLPYFAISMVAGVGIVLASMVLFDLPVRGAWWLLLLSMALYLFGALAMGLLISTIAQSQQVAFQVALLASFLPTMLLSGFMFPFRGMPGWAQALGEVFPLTHFLRLVRGILLKGNGAPDTVAHLWPIALFLVVVALAALLRYRRTLD